MNRQEPTLSVLLPTDSLATVATVLSAFRAQDGGERLEIVIAAPESAGITGDEPELQGFCRVQVVHVDDVSRMPAARARAVRAATAPLLLFAESHAYPRPGYLQALLDAHRASWAVVGPAIGNANPDSLVSWSSLLMDYGPWIDYAERGPKDDVPGHNSVYKRSVLMGLDSRMDELMTADSIMHSELRRAGYELAMEPDAVVDHLNVSGFYWAMRERFQSGRAFGTVRARNWSSPRRLVYTFASPAIPFVRLRRALSDIRRTGRSRQLLPQLLPVLTTALLVSAAGEAVGYAFRKKGSLFLLYDMELHKTHYLGRTDRKLERHAEASVTWA